MNCYAHIFIGKEFEQLVQDIGRVSYKYGDSAVSYMNYYLFDFEQSAPILKKLSIESSAPSPDLAGIDKYINVQWVDKDIRGGNLTDTYRLDIFNDILGGVNRGAHNCLYVCIHFAFYKESAFKRLSTVYKAIKDANMPTKLSFLGYCGDIAEMISLEEKDAEKLSSKDQVLAYKRFRDENNVLINQHLVLLQNSFQNGMPLNLTGKSLVDTVSLLLLQYVSHYDAFYPDTIACSDMMSFGISAISLDKYRFVDYLFCRTMLHAMDVSSVMESEVSVNDVFAKVRSILHNKKSILSEFLAKHEHGNAETRNIVEAEHFIDKEAGAIIDKCEDIMHENKSMPVRAAILAALLQTKCDLFQQMLFDPESPDLNDLFIEPIDYFIEHDKSHFYWKDEETPLVNPIKELKTLNRKLINTESQILKLREELKTHQSELENYKLAEMVTSFEKDGYFHIEDRRYRLLPNTHEEPLQETYQPHEIHADSLDLRKNFREIQDQRAQGSCLAFALTSIFEYVMRSNNHCEESDLSEAFLYYNARKLDPDNSENEDSGSRFKPALDSLCKYGIAKEALCRYDENSYDKEPTQEAYDDAKKRLLRKAINVSRHVADIKSALEDGYPVAASFTLCPSFSNIVQGFVPMPTKDEIEASVKDLETGENRHTSHAMVIVGFDDKIGCFLVRNSWGAEWGDHGYCYIPYSYIEDENLLNFACILTEIESVESGAKQIKDIPILHLDDGDINIRYHIVLEALRRETENATYIKTERDARLMSFEYLKQLLSNHNDCESYIKQTCEKITEEQDVLRERIKKEQTECDREYDDYRSYRKRLVYKVAGISSGILLFVWIYNRILHKIAHQDWVHAIRDFVETVFVFVWNLFAEKPVGSLSIDLYIDWIHYLVILIVFSIFFYKARRAWDVWRESKNEHERQINLCNKQILTKQKEKEGFRFNTQVARRWLDALIQIQSSVQQRYTNIISRINNLRSWHTDLDNEERYLDLQSSVPYTTLLDKTILDKFFETAIMSDPSFEIDFSDGLEQHRNTEDYLMGYQNNIRNKIIGRLVAHPRLKAFNITEHLLSDAFEDIARKIVVRGDNETVSLENVKRQSDIFMHINPIADRGIVMPSTYIVAPVLTQQESKMRQKVGCGFDTYLPSTDPYCLVMLQITCLKFDECIMFQ